MKKRLLTVWATGLFVLAASSGAQALTINSGAIEVGSIDTLLTSTISPNSGEEAEVNWVNGCSWHNVHSGQLFQRRF